MLRFYLFRCAAAIALFVAVVLLLLSAAVAAEKADLIWVRKSEYMLHLIVDQHIMASYPIALGARPLGHKQRAHDNRTPEGLYFIDYRNEESLFFLSLHISYPNERDRRYARQRQFDPGGDIVIHGEPNDEDQRLLLSQAANRRNWTDGCIAVSNQAMVVLWHSVEEGTPILIDP